MNVRAEQTESEPCPEKRTGDPGAGAERPGEDPDVAQWVRKAQAGDHVAFESLVLHFQDRVWRRALYRIGDREEAYDLSQEVFILCFRKLHQFRGESKFWTWLCRVIDNQVKNRQGWLRRRGKGRTYSLNASPTGEEDGAGWDPPSGDASPRRRAEAGQALEALNEKLAMLSADHREVMLMRFADGLAYEAIAEDLQISLGTVKSRLNRARRELRQMMKDHLD